MTPKRRKMYTFYIDPELAEGLKILKEQTGAPESESVRRAIAGYLRKAGIIRAARPRGRPRKRS